jgi:hypothetical protein
MTLTRTSLVAGADNSGSPAVYEHGTVSDWLLAGALALSRVWEGLEPVELLGYSAARRNEVRHSPFIGP